MVRLPTFTRKQEEGPLQWRRGRQKTFLLDLNALTGDTEKRGANKARSTLKSNRLPACYKGKKGGGGGGDKERKGGEEREGKVITLTPWGASYIGEDHFPSAQG